MVSPHSFPPDNPVERARNLATVAERLEVGAWFLTVSGIVGGVLVILGGGDVDIGAGLGVIVAAVAVGVTLSVTARALRLFAEYVASRLKTG